MGSPSLFLFEERVKTFKFWPFSDRNKCNILNMAQAGFYSVATGSEDADAAKCFLCGKELDGWEPDDDPWVEHKSHASQCGFVQLGKNEGDLLMSEYLSIVKQYMINKAKRMGGNANVQLDERAKGIRRRCLSRK